MFRANTAHLQQDFLSLKHFLPADTRRRLEASKEYAFYRRVFCRIPEELFADLYSSDPASRPNAPINALVSALLLQHMNNWTFEELFDRMAFDLKTRAALGLWTLDADPFCPATLFNFQRRLRDHMAATGSNKFELLFDQLTQEDLKTLGLNATIQRSDSTQIGTFIREYTRVELLVEIVLRMWRALSEQDKALHQERFAPYVTAQTAGQFLFRLRREDLPGTLEGLGQLYAWMVDRLQADYGTREIYGIVRRVFEEQFTRAADRILLRPDAEIASASLQSPDDPDATFRFKDGEDYTGYVLHATETAHPDNPLQLVIDVALAPNNQDDSTILKERLPAMHRKTPDLKELHTDGAYGSAGNDVLMADFQIDHVQTGIRGRSSQAPLEVTALDDGRFQVRCAAGHVVQSVPARLRHKADFQAAWCSSCPLAAVCPAIRRNDDSRRYYVDQATALRQARHRRLLELPPERQHLRANVEATMQEFKTPTRKGKLRVRRRVRVTQNVFLRALMINFGRIFRYKTSKPAAGKRVGRPASEIQLPQPDCAHLRRSSLLVFLRSLWSHRLILAPLHSVAR
jgi:DDE family transposase/transposase-like protein DUF772